MIDTPELVFLLGQHLHPADLRRCIQVSRLWHETLISCLWRELDDSERPWYQMFEKAQALSNDEHRITLPFDDPRRCLSELIHKYGHHIRRLRITHIWTLECCLQASLAGITTLYWRVSIRECKYINVERSREVSISKELPVHLKCEPALYPRNYTNEWDYVSRCFWSLVSRNRNLTLVDAHNNKLLMPQPEVLHSLLGSLSWLRTLRNILMPIGSLQQLKSFAPNLDALTLADLPAMHDFFMNMPTVESVHHHLRSLALLGTLTLYQISNVFRLFPNLEYAQLLLPYTNSSWISDDPPLTPPIPIPIPIHLESTYLRQLEVNSLDWVTSSGATIHFPRLESLQIQYLSHFRQLNALLAHCPTVCSVQIQNFTGIWGKSDTQDTMDGTDVRPEPVLAPNVRTLRIVTTTLYRTKMEESIQFMWRTVPHLVDLSLRVSNPPLIAALAQCCPALRRVNVGSVLTQSNDEHSAVVDLLTSCSDLRTLEGVRLKIGPQEFRDGGAWVCHKLEVLQLEITGLGEVRQEVHGDDEGDGCGGVERKYVLQHVVYNQLAHLTRLRSLDLSVLCSCNTYYVAPSGSFGHWYRCHRHDSKTRAPLVPMDTLQLTLASGLSLLSSLAQLKELGIRGVDHNIRREELLWMQEYWPRLKWIRGVAPKIEEAEEMREVRTWYVEDGTADFLERYPDNLVDLFGED